MYFLSPFKIEIERGNLCILLEIENLHLLPVFFNCKFHAVKDNLLSTI